MARTRNEKITIRLTEKEKEQVIKKFEKSKKYYKTYTDYFLSIFENSKVFILDTQKVEKELKAIGNNINQWTKGVNTFNEVDRKDVLKLEGEIVKIWHLLRSLKKEIMANTKNTHSKMN